MIGLSPILEGGQQVVNTVLDGERRPEIPGIESAGSDPAKLAPAHLVLDVCADRFDAVAEYGCRADGFAAYIAGQMILTIFLHATEEDSFTTAAKQAAAEAAAAGFPVQAFDYDLVGTGDIAARINCARQTVRQYIAGSRGPGGFPAPFGSTGHSSVWDWGSVNAWFRTHHGTGDPGYLPARAVLQRLNHWLLTQ